MKVRCRLVTARLELVAPSATHGSVTYNRRMWNTLRSMATALVVAASSLSAQTAQGRNPPTLLFITDFGIQDGAVAVCKGVMWGIDPSLRVVDLTHEIPAYDIETA